MAIDFELLDSVLSSYDKAQSTADMNNAVNSEIEILRSIILEILAKYYPEVNFPNGNEDFINTRISNTRELASTIYYYGMGYTGTIIGQLVGAEITTDLRRILKFCLEGDIFDENDEAKLLKIKLSQYLTTE